MDAMDLWSKKSSRTPYGSMDAMALWSLYYGSVVALELWSKKSGIAPCGFYGWLSRGSRTESCWLRLMTFTAIVSVISKTNMMRRNTIRIIVIDVNVNDYGSIALRKLWM